MKKRTLILVSAILCGIILTAACNNEKAPAPVLRVGMLDGLGSGHTNMTEAYEAARLDSRISIRYITSANIAWGVLDSLDVLIIPGGGGSMHTFSLGETNINIIKKWTENGGGILCICAGAYALSHTPDYACFGMNGAQVVDLDHSSRGQGLCALGVTEEGKKLFPELSDLDTIHVMFENGPMLAPADSAVLAESPAGDYTVFATMLSDVHVGEGFQAGISPGKPFLLGNNYGKGRVFTSIGHPEGSASFGWMIPRILFWCAQKEDMALPVEYKAPALDKEVIMSNEDLGKEGSMYRTFVYGTKEEKLECFSWMMNHPSWSMKTWVSGLLYDKEPEVRSAAAAYIGSFELLTAKKDLEAACALEQDPQVKAVMQKSVQTINSLYR